MSSKLGSGGTRLWNGTSYSSAFPAVCEGMERKEGRGEEGGRGRRGGGGGGWMEEGERKEVGEGERRWERGRGEEGG